MSIPDPRRGKFERLAEGALSAADTRIAYLLSQPADSAAARQMRVKEIALTAAEALRVAEIYHQAARVLAGEQPE